MGLFKFNKKTYVAGWVNLDTAGSTSSLPPSVPFTRRTGTLVSRMRKLSGGPSANSRMMFMVCPVHGAWE